jgi:hypothetical protein
MASKSDLSEYADTLVVLPAAKWGNGLRKASFNARLRRIFASRWYWQWLVYIERELFSDN